MAQPPSIHDDDFPDAELTPTERKRLRQMLEADKRARWFWSTIRTWVLGAGAIAVAFTAIMTWAKDVPRLFK